MKITSINVGMPREVEWQGKKVLTGIFKDPLPKGVSVWVGKAQIEGDGQADLSVHGGVNKAVYALGQDAFGFWDRKLNRKLLPGELGENLTLSKLDETKVCIGDTIGTGKVTLQVVEPRFPCFKLGIRFQDESVIKMMMESMRPGIYFRVLEEGKITVGDEFKILKADPQQVPLIELFKMKNPGQRNLTLLKKALQIESLTPKLKTKIQALLD